MLIYGSTIDYQSQFLILLWDTGYGQNTMWTLGNTFDSPRAQQFPYFISDEYLLLVGLNSIGKCIWWRFGSKGNVTPSVIHCITCSLAPKCLYASGLSLGLLVIIVPHIPQCWYISWLIVYMNSRGEEWSTSAMPSIVKIASRSVLRSKLPGDYLCCLMRLN